MFRKKRHNRRCVVHVGRDLPWNPVDRPCMLPFMSTQSMDMSRGNSDPGHPPGRSVRVSTDLVIETPENVVLTYRLAGPAVRLLAYLIDFVIRAALLIALYVLAMMGAVAGLAGISIGMFLLMIFFIDWAY